MKHIEIIESYIALTPKDIISFENNYKIKLPEDYKKFLLKYNGGHPIEDTFKMIQAHSNDKEWGYVGDVNRFLGIHEGENSNINKDIKTFKNRIPKKLIPIAYDSGGNLICLCIDGPNYGKVYFWDHNWEAEEGEEPTYDNVYLIAHNFTDFINSLYEYKLPEDSK